MTEHRSRRRSGQPSSSRTVGKELTDMLVAYAKQETLGPFRGLFRSVAFGVAGSVAMSGGVVLLLVALLRLLQDDTGTTFEGHLSWLPYLITLTVAIGVLGLVAWWIVSGRGLSATDARRKSKRSRRA